MGSLFAIPAPGIITPVALIMVVVLILTCKFLTRAKGRRGLWWKFSLLSPGVGPLMGFIIGYFASTASNVHPHDVTMILPTLTLLGVIAGVIGAFVIGFAALITSSPVF